MKKFLKLLRDHIDDIAVFCFSCLCLAVSFFVVVKACSPSCSTAYADERDNTDLFYGNYIWDNNPYLGELGSSGAWYLCSSNFISGGQSYDSIVISKVKNLPSITLNYHKYTTQHNYTVAFDGSNWTEPDYRYVSFPVPTHVEGATSNTWILRHLHFVDNPYKEPVVEVLSTPSNFYYSANDNLLRWSAVENADGYQVISNNMTYAIDVTTNYFQPVGDGSYKVRAYRNTSDGVIYSDWSSLVAVSSPVQVSLDLRYSNNLLTWNRISDAVRYQVVYSPQDFPSDFVDRLSNYITTYVDNFSYSPQFDGYYAVVAYSQNGTILEISSSLRVSATGNNQIYSSSPLLLFLQPVYSFMSYPFFGVSLNQVFGVVMFVLVASIFLKLFAGG